MSSTVNSIPYITPLEVYRLPYITPLHLYRIPNITPLHLYSYPIMHPFTDHTGSIVKIYDINLINMTCHNLYQLRYKPSTIITGGLWGNVRV